MATSDMSHGRVDIFFTQGFMCQDTVDEKDLFHWQCELLSCNWTIVNILKNPFLFSFPIF